jgi:hypothetical protein
VSSPALHRRPSNNVAPRSLARDCFDHTRRATPSCPRDLTAQTGQMRSAPRPPRRNRRTAPRRSCTARPRPFSGRSAGNAGCSQTLPARLSGGSAPLGVLTIPLGDSLRRQVPEAGFEIGGDVAALVNLLVDEPVLLRGSKLACRFLLRDTERRGDVCCRPNALGVDGVQELVGGDCASPSPGGMDGVVPTTRSMSRARRTSSARFVTTRRLAPATAAAPRASAARRTAGRSPAGSSASGAPCGPCGPATAGR